MNIKEEWRPIKGYEGFYEVSNLGRVRSLDRVVKYKNGVSHLHKGTVLSSKTNNCGYKEVMIGKNGKKKSFLIHRLVAAAFIPNPENHPAVNHIDGNKQNNCIDNLEWCTTRQNHLHALENGLMKKGAEHHRSKLSLEQIHIIRSSYIPRDKKYGGAALAKKYGVDTKTINRIIHNVVYKN